MYEDQLPVSVDTYLPGMAEGQPTHEEYARDDMYERLQLRIRAMISDARDYNDTELAPAREKADRYYNGIEPALEEEGRSTIVATEVQDVIMGIMPSLMRIFTSTEPVCNFIATNEKMVLAARQATDYINFKLMNDWDGFRLLYSLIMDSVRKGGGPVQWHTETVEKVMVRDYHTVTEEQVAMFFDQVPTAELVDAKPSPIGPGTYDIRVRIVSSAPELKLSAIPPEEFRIDRNAKSVKEAQLVGRERVMRRGQLIELGYPEDLVDMHSGTGTSFVWSLERQYRNPGDTIFTADSDPEASGVVYGEYYVMVDTDGDGIEELNLVRTMGDEDTIVDIEPADRRKIAVFLSNLEPHTAIGKAISEQCYDLQRIKTNLMRNSLDSLAQTIYPRQVINENVVNIDDVLNPELGAPIRTRGDPATSVVQLQARFDGEQVMPFFAYLDQVRQLRTGVSEASKGVDPRALQSTTVKGVDMLISGAQERIELIARTLANTGMRDMYSGLLSEICDQPNVAEMIFVRGAYVNVDPSQFDPSIPVQVNPNIGKGTDADRMMMLTQVKATQEMIIDKMGPDNPLVTPVEYRNTIEDLLTIANIKDVSRYFKAVTEQDVQAALKAKQDAAANAPNPQLILSNTEAEKVRASTAKAVADHQFRDRKLTLDDNFRHLQLQAKMEEALIMAMGQFGVQLNHDMAKHVLSTAKDLHIAENSGGDEASGTDGE